MKVTSLKAQVKNPDRVSVFVDGVYSFSLMMDQLIEARLKKGVELGESDIQALKKRSEDGKKKARLFEWVLNRPRSTQEFRDYCYRKRIDSDLRDAWLIELEQRNYLNDERFAEWFAELRLRKLRSKQSIVRELVTKGVSMQTASSVLAHQGSSDKDSLAQLIEKLKKRTRYQDEKKLIAYLVSKGFAYQEVKSQLSRPRSS